MPSGPATKVDQVSAVAPFVSLHQADDPINLRREVALGVEKIMDRGRSGVHGPSNVPRPLRRYDPGARISRPAVEKVRVRFRSAGRQARLPVQPPVADVLPG